MKIKILITSLILAAFFCGCMTEKKARRTAEKFYNEHPRELAGVCAEKFPPSIEYKKGDSVVIIEKDTITIQGDSVECPETVPGKPVKVKCPESKTIRQTVLRVDTFVLENTAKIHSLAFRLDTTAKRAAMLEQRLQDMTNDRDKWKGTAQKRYWFIWLLIALIGAGVFLKIRKII